MNVLKSVLLFSFFIPLQFLFSQKIEKYYGVDSLIGLKKLDGKIVVEPTYSYVSDFIYDGKVALVSKGELSGIINGEGKIIIPLEYNYVGGINEKLFFACHLTVENEKEVYKCALINHLNARLTAFEYDNYNALTAGLVGVRKNGKWGYIDYKGKPKIPHNFDKISFFAKNKAIVEIDKELFYIDTKGTVLEELPEVFPNYIVSQDAGEGFSLFDKNGIHTTEVLYKAMDKLFDSKNLYAVLEHDSETKKIITGAETFISNYDDYLNAGNNLVICVDSTFRLLNKKGNFIDSNRYSYVKPLGDNFLVNFGGKISFLDPENEPYFNRKIKGGKWFLVNEKGLKISPEFAAMYDSNDEFLVTVQSNQAEVEIKNDEIILKKFENGKFGLIDFEGKQILPNNYSEINVSVFDNSDLLCVASGETVQYLDSSGFYPIYNPNAFYGFVNQKNEVVIPLIYTRAMPFSTGLAAVSLKGKWGFVNKTGDVIIPIIYDFCYPFYGATTFVKKGEKYGIVDFKGEVVVDFIFDKVLEFSSTGKAKVLKNGEEMWLDLMGTVKK